MHKNKNKLPAFKFDFYVFAIDLGLWHSMEFQIICSLLRYSMEFQIISDQVVKVKLFAVNHSQGTAVAQAHVYSPTSVAVLGYRPMILCTTTYTVSEHIIHGVDSVLKSGQIQF